MLTPERPAVDALLTRVASGDRAAFADLYDALAPQANGVACTVLRDRTLAEEVVQEVFIEVWRTAPRYDAGRGGARGWVLRLTRLRAIDRLRSHLATLDRDDREAALQRVASPLSVEDEVVRDIDGAHVRDALDALGEPHRTAVRLAFFAGLTHSELAAATGVPLGTAKTRVRDGLRKLRAVIGTGEPASRPTPGKEGARGTL